MPSRDRDAESRAAGPFDADQMRVLAATDPALIAKALGLGRFGQSAAIPQAPVLPVQYPQLTPQQMPPALPQVFGQGSGAMPMMRSRMMANVLGPLMQPNYGMPIIGQGYGLPPPTGINKQVLT